MAASELDMALHRSVMERRRPIEEQIAAEDAKRRADWYAEREALGGAKLTKEKIKKLLRSDRKLYCRDSALAIYLGTGRTVRSVLSRGVAGLGFIAMESE
eukprot:g18663.t1